MARVFKAIAGDTKTKLRITCKDADTGAVIDLTGATANLLWRIDGGTLVTKTGITVVAPPTSGIVEYQFTTGELIAGYMEAEVELTDVSAKKNTSFKFNIDIEARL